MKIYLLLLFTFVFPSIGMSQNTGCSKFKNGTFSLKENTADYIITRKDSIQIEENLSTGLITEIRVKWISDCVYTLEPIRHIKNPEDTKFPYGMIVTATIVRVKKNSYIQESTCNLFEGKHTGEVFKIKKQ